LLSAVPSAIVAVSFRAFNKTKFVINCSPSMDGALVLDKAHCGMDTSFWDMAPSAVSELLMIYGAAKTLAHFLVKLDPEATGNLSELQAWQRKTAKKKAVDFKP